MFDKNLIQSVPETTYTPYEKVVHEHKAPTDDSVRLLNEMEEKALDNLIRKQSHALCGHTVGALQLDFEFNLSTQEQLCTYSFILNGRFIRKAVIIEDGKLTNNYIDSSEYLKKILAESIAGVIVEEFKDNIVKA